MTASYTYRRMTDLLWTPLIGVTRASYTQTSTLTGNAPEVGAFSVPLYAPTGVAATRRRQGDGESSRLHQQDRASSSRW